MMNLGVYSFIHIKSLNFNKWKRRFSLIELMTVIFVILLLISFTVPVFTGMQKKARELKCLNNYKQMGALILMYVNDFDGQLPGAFKGSYFHPKSMTLTSGFQGKLSTYLMEGEFYSEKTMGRISKYGRDFTGEFITSYTDGGLGYQELEIFVCPDAANAVEPIAVITGGNTNRKRYNNLHHPSSGMENIPTSYTSVDAFTNDPYSNHSKCDNESERLGEIKNPSEKIFLVETSNYGSNDFAVYDDYTYLQVFGSRQDLTKEYSYSKPTQGFVNHFKMNFFHDDIDEFWVSSKIKMNKTFGRSVDNGYQKAYDNLAEVYGKKDHLFFAKATGLYTWVRIISYVDPVGYNKFQDMSGNPEFVFSPDNYFYEDLYQHMVGNMNILFADMSARKVSNVELDRNWSSWVNKEL